MPRPLPDTRQLGPCVTVLFGKDQGKYPDGNSVLVRGSSGSLLIDPSQTVHAASPALHVDQVLLTHAHEDHAAGLSAVQSSAISVHQRDLAALQSVAGLMALYGLPSDRIPAMTDFVTERFHYLGWPNATGFEDGATWDLGGAVVRAIAAPGHTGGHCLLSIEQANGPTVVVTGDIDLSSFGPYYGDAGSSLEEFEATLRMLPTVAADHYVTFHHKGVVDDHDEFVAAVAAFSEAIARREAALLGLLEPPRTLEQLVEIGIVYRPGTRPPLFGDSVEKRSIQQHLDRLLADDAIASDGREYWRL
ncbi:MAG: MBL fold metallo-hydrolase [Actinomycetia bacterium]|nr:MBL fold metallo-hydrolase [Actinomycetes bacterium]